VHGSEAPTERAQPEPVPRKGDPLKKVLAAITGVVAVTVIATAAIAAVHFKSGPSFVDQGLTLAASGSIAGLGNADVTVVLGGTGAITATCTNPAGNIAPGNLHPSVALTGTQTISASAIKNGNLSFSVVTAGPGPISAKAAGCPNNNWTATITDVTFSGATLTFYQNGVAVLSSAF
jgi:hypothetical protein